MPNVRDHDASVYLRLQGDALSVGGYEQNPIFWDEVTMIHSAILQRCLAPGAGAGTRPVLFPRVSAAYILAPLARQHCGGSARPTDR